MSKDSIGALWQKKAKNGTNYLSGMVTLGNKAYPIVCFLNQYKKEAKHPDYRIFPQESREKSVEKAVDNEGINQEQLSNLEINPNEIPF